MFAFISEALYVIASVAGVILVSILLLGGLYEYFTHKDSKVGDLIENPVFTIFIFLISAIVIIVYIIK